ncbi:MAG: hypothetical protein WAO61_08780 [Solirubrobacterales bacterium]
MNHVPPELGRLAAPKRSTQERPHEQKRRQRKKHVQPELERSEHDIQRRITYYRRMRIAEKPDVEHEHRQRSETT